jgi:hypothetical protein
VALGIAGIQASADILATARSADQATVDIRVLVFQDIQGILGLVASVGSAGRQESAYQDIQDIVEPAGLVEFSAQAGIVGTAVFQAEADIAGISGYLASVVFQAAQVIQVIQVIAGSAE